jgi:hypothetical protein
MRNLPAAAPIRTYYLDLVFLNASLQAGGHVDLATDTQKELASLKAGRDSIERAEELEVIATAVIAGRDATLDDLVKTCAAHVRAHDPDQYDDLFPKAPSRVTELGYREEIKVVQTLVAQLGTLEDDDPVRVQFVPQLTSAAGVLEGALNDKDVVLRNVAVLRLGLVSARAKASVLRTRIYGELVKRMGDKKAADKFFRPSSSRGAADDPDVPVAAPPAAPAPPA